MKSIEEMTEKELLAELLKQQKKGNRGTRILSCFVGVLATIVLIASLLLIPRTLQTLHNAETLIASGQEKIEEVEGVIESIDIDSLNQSIHSLSDLLKPLSDLFHQS